MQNLLLDPEKRDYVLKNGSSVPTDDIKISIYYALTIPKNNWLYGVRGQGSLIYKLVNQKRTNDVEVQFASYASQAIQSQIIDTGKATKAQIYNLQSTPTGTLNNIVAQPSISNLSNQLKLIPV